MLGPRLDPVHLAETLSFRDIGTAPPTTVADPCIYCVGDVVYFRDADGKEWPLVPGADGAGVVTVTHAMSPYQAHATDRIFLVDASAGVVTITLVAAPVSGQQALFVDAARSFASHALTVNGNGRNINGASTLTVNVQDACPLLTYGGTTWETGSTATASAASVKAITSAGSPYQVLSTDQVLLVDSSGGVVTLTMESAPSATRAPLAIVDAARSFATHNVTVNGNGKNIRGSATLVLARRDGGVILYYTGTDWELNASQYYTADSIQGTALQPTGLLRMFSTVGSNGAGTVTLTGAKAGDYIIGVVDITDHSSLSPTTDFTQQIAVNDQADQLSATDLSAKTLVFLLVAKS